MLSSRQQTERNSHIGETMEIPPGSVNLASKQSLLYVPGRSYKLSSPKVGSEPIGIRIMTKQGLGN
jgi:hypothetical protein